MLIILLHLLVKEAEHYHVLLEFLKLQAKKSWINLLKWDLFLFMKWKTLKDLKI